MLFAFCTLGAQNNMPSKEEMQRKVLQQLQMRDASKLHLQHNYPLSATPKVCATAENSGLQ